jgi:hypothetical protein
MAEFLYFGKIIAVLILQQFLMVLTKTLIRRQKIGICGKLKFSAKNLIPKNPSKTHKFCHKNN